MLFDLRIEAIYLALQSSFISHSDRFLFIEHYMSYEVILLDV